MRAVLDHVGIAVKDVAAALAFYRDALGLEIEAAEDVPSQGVRARFVRVAVDPPREAQASLLDPAGPRLELIEATRTDSPIAAFLEKRGPGLHHLTLRVEDVQAALTQLRARGARLIDERPRPGAEGSLVAFVHPSSTHGVLIELKQSSEARARTAKLGSSAGDLTARSPHTAPIQRFSVGDLELISLSDGFFALDGGAMFGVVPKSLWAPKAPPDERNRIALAMRPLIVRGRRTLIVDAGVGDKEDARFSDIYGLDRARHLDHALADAGLSAEDVDIVLATHLHFDHAGGFTRRDANGRLQPRFPRAQYIVRRGEWEDATHPTVRNRASYLADNYLPLADSGVLQLVDDDQTIMPGVKVRRTGGHTMHHQMVVIESNGRTAVFVADLIPTTAHVPDPWIMGYDLYPMDTLAAKQSFVKQAIEREWLIFFEHDPSIAAGYIREQDGKRRVHPAS
ncbi:MAG: methylmalonyl-CoA epimerase [Blastocatellia bacterium]|nr:MAG: methylmalonyl-CoA epimerase [Blastocatellia bacterium]